MEGLLSTEPTPSSFLLTTIDAGYEEEEKNQCLERKLLSDKEV